MTTDALLKELNKELNNALRKLPFLKLADPEYLALIQALSQYIQLMAKWNQSMNLTAVREPIAMVTRHIIDSLSLLPYLDNSHTQTILDVGTGPGLPGLPLSLVLKNKAFTLLDSHLKKQYFLECVVQLLGLKNVSLQCLRVESYKPPFLFDTIISRAFAPLGKMLFLTNHLLAPGGRFLAMKGKVEPQELHAVGVEYKIESVINLQPLTSQSEARHVIVVTKIKEE